MNEPKSGKFKNGVEPRVCGLVAIAILAMIACVVREICEPVAPVPPPIGMDETVEWRVFLVATNHYDVKIRNIQYAESDVDDLRRSLLVLGVKDENITILKSSNKEFSLGTSKEAIEDAYDEFLSTLTDNSANSAAFVYLSGHGFTQRDWLGRERSYYAPSDFQFNKVFDKRVSIDKMMKRLAKTKARFRWMCVDACRDPLDRGIFSNSLSIAKAPPEIVLTQSCKSGEQSYEVGKRENAPFENGLFTRAFVDAVSGRATEADANNDRALTLGEIRRYVESRVPRDAKRYWNAEQTPVFSSFNGATLNRYDDYALFNDLPIMGYRPEEWRIGQQLREEAEKLVNQEDYAAALEKINQAYNVLDNVDEIAALKDEITKAYRKNEAETALQNAKVKLEAQRFSEAEDCLRRALEFDPESQKYELFQNQIESERNAYVLNESLLESSESTLEAGEIATVKIAGIDVRFRWCPSGEFIMGSLPDEEADYPGTTLRNVELTQGFWIAETETSQALWKATMGEENNPSANQDGELPVEQVSWNDCQNFIERIQVHAPVGMKFQLPTEAQWEYACRAGTDSQYSFGDEWEPDKANNGDNTLPVGSLDYANPWGVRDMHGNVREWIADWYATYSEDDVVDPLGAEEGKLRVLRGGCVRSESVGCFSGIRFRLPPEASAWDLGFRLALVINREKQTLEPPQPTESSKTHSNGDQIKETYASPYRPGELRIVKIAGIDVRFRWCPPGEFTMGSPENENGRNRVEVPHKVTIKRGFWLAETETSQELWKKINRKNPSRFEGDFLPVERVSWLDCQNFIDKIQRYNSRYTHDRRHISEQESFRLPTEEEWEYACRAGTDTRYSFGDEWNVSKANNDEQGTKPVGSYRYANAWGLKDMHGNVWEWCKDVCRPYPEDEVATTSRSQYHYSRNNNNNNNNNNNYYNNININNNSNNTSISRVGRGGGWDSEPELCRSANRGWLPQTSRNSNLGFRLMISDDTVVPVGSYKGRIYDGRGAYGH